MKNIIQIILAIAVFLLLIFVVKGGLEEDLGWGFGRSAFLAKNTK